MREYHFILSIYLIYLIFINPIYLLEQKTLSYVSLLDICIDKTFKTLGNLFGTTTAKRNMLKGLLVASCENGNLVKTQMIFQGDSA